MDTRWKGWEFYTPQAYIIVKLLKKYFPHLGKKYYTYLENVNVNFNVAGLEPAPPWWSVGSSRIHHILDQRFFY